jgi:hypothetical protein
MAADQLRHRGHRGSGPHALSRQGQCKEPGDWQQGPSLGAPELWNHSAVPCGCFFDILPTCTSRADPDSMSERPRLGGREGGGINVHPPASLGTQQVPVSVRGME